MSQSPNVRYYGTLLLYQSYQNAMVDFSFCANFHILYDIFV